MANLTADYEYQVTVKKVGATNPVGYTSATVTDESQNEASVQYISLAAGATDTVVPFGGVAVAKLVSLQADGIGLTVKLAGATETIAFTSLLITGCDIAAGATAMLVSNDSGQQINLQVVIAG